MSLTIVTTSLLIFLTLCCRTGSLLTVGPATQKQFAPTSVSISCYFDNTCSNPSWDGPVLNEPSRYRVTSDNMMSTLTIDPLREEDEGNYYCICNGRRTVPSSLVVHHLPSVANVSRNQTFHRGETVRVLCDADPGDPPAQMIWIYNGVKITNSQQLRVDNDGQALIIENIDDHNAGVYECAFNDVSTGRIFANIQVNVVDRPPEEVQIFPPDFPRNVSISYGDRLHLNCRNEQADPSLTFVWIVRDGDEPVSSHELDLAPEDVVTGAYRCLASGNGMEYQHTVLVTVVDIPPLPLTSDHIFSMNALEREPLLLHTNFRHRLDKSNLTVQWYKMKNGELVDFDSRFYFSVSRTYVRFNISSAKLTDRGSYVVNVTNPYGFATLRVVINVRELERTEIKVKIENVDCTLVEEYLSVIVEQLVDAHECSFCGDVGAERNVRLNCTGDSSILTLTLLSQDTLPLEQHISLRFADSTVSAELCPDGSCLTTTTILPSTSLPNRDLPKDNTVLIVAVAVTIIGILFVLLFVFIATLFIRRSTHYCEKQRDRVGQEDAIGEVDPVVVVQHIAATTAAPQEEPECTGYARISKKTHSSSPPNQNPNSTVTLPYSPPPPHIMPLLPQSNGSTSSGANRPQKLYFRSHSYHGSTRTPQA